MMDTQEPLTSVYRILSFADAIFIGTLYRRTDGGGAARRRDAWRAADTRTPIYHYADFYCYVVVYTLQVLTLESATFLSSGWSVARHQDARYKFIKDCDFSLPSLKLRFLSLIVCGEAKDRYRYFFQKDIDLILSPRCYKYYVYKVNY